MEAPDPSREVVRRKLNYPKPREGTETSRSPKGCGGSRRTVELPQAPRGDGNLHKPSRVVVDCGVELPQAPRGDGNLGRLPSSSKRRYPCLVELPQAPRGDGNPKRVRVLDTSILSPLLNYPKPREGTETRSIRQPPTPHWLCVELPQAPRGDGNYQPPYRTFFYRSVELPQAPRGDGN